MLLLKEGMAVQGFELFSRGVSERIAVNFLLSGILKCHSVTRLTSWMLELLVGVIVYRCNFESVAYREGKNLGFIRRLRNSSSEDKLAPELCLRMWHCHRRF